MFVRSVLASVRRTLRPGRLARAALPACGLLWLLAGPAPAQGPAGAYYPTTWRRLAPSPALASAAPLVIARPAALSPTPATILRGTAPDDLGLLPPPEEVSGVKTVQLAPRDLPPAEEVETSMPQFPISLQPPGSQRVFSRESERNLQERIRQSDRATLTEPLQFPPEPVLAKPGERVERRWPWQPEFAEPNYVCRGPLFYEQINFERYGWDLGAVAPFVSLGVFWYDLATAPYHMLIATADHTWCGGECSGGYCLPGNPVPLLLYPPQWPITIEFDDGRANPPCGEQPCLGKK
jgi:hypothetical protein